MISDQERCRRYVFVLISCGNVLFGYSAHNLRTKYCKAFNQWNTKEIDKEYT